MELNSKKKKTKMKFLKAPFFFGSVEDICLTIEEERCPDITQQRDVQRRLLSAEVVGGTTRLEM